MSTDRVSASVLALFALFVIWESGQLPLGTLRQPGPAFVPVLLASLLLIFSICLIGSAASAPSLTSLQWTEGRHALAILIACVFSVLAIERLGYRLTMLLLLGVLVKFVEKRGWALSITFALLLAFGSFFLFYTILRVPLPRGPLGF